MKLVIADLGTKADALRLIDEASDAARRTADLLNIFHDYAKDHGWHQDTQR